MTRINSIYFPETAICPDCGHEIDGAEDVLGFVYRCEQMDCMSTYDAEDLFPASADPYAALRTRLAALYAKRGDDMARPTLTVGYQTIIGAREIAAYEARQAALAAQKGDA